MLKVGNPFFLAGFGLLAIISVSCYAQDTPANEEVPTVSEISVPQKTPATQETAGEQVGVGTLEGTIKSVDQDQLTFKFSYPITFAFEELNFTILPATEIIKNMENADFMDMQPGDRAIVDYIDDSSDPLKAVRITLVGSYEE